MNTTTTSMKKTTGALYKRQATFALLLGLLFAATAAQGQADKPTLSKQYAYNKIMVVKPLGYTVSYYTTDGTMPTNASAQVTGDNGNTIDVSDLDDGTVVCVVSYNNAGTPSDSARVVIQRFAALGLTATASGNSDGRIVVKAPTRSDACEVYYTYENPMQINLSSTSHVAANTPLDLDNNHYQDEAVLRACAFPTANADRVKYPSKEETLSIRRYEAPSIRRAVIDEQEKIIVTNPNEGTTLYYYTGSYSTTPTATSLGTDAVDTVAVASTLTTYRFYVGGRVTTDDTILHSPELVTTIDPDATVPEVSITEQKTYDLIQNMGSQTLYYDYFNPGTTTEAINAQPLNAEDDYANKIAANGNLSVESAPSGAVYRFYHRLMRTEVQQLGGTTLSGTTVSVCDGVGASQLDTIERYADPEVIPYWRRLANPAIKAYPAAADGTDEALTVKYRTDGNTPAATGSSSMQVTDSIVPVAAEDFGKTFRFRTFGPTKYPSWAGSAPSVPAHRYNAPAISNYIASIIEQDGTITRYSSGTFVAPQGTKVYINTRFAENDTLVNPDPSVAGTWDYVVNAGNGFPTGFYAEKFKMVVSADSAVATMFPSAVVTVDKDYSGYYVVHHYDDATGEHHYLSLDSTNRQMRTLTRFDHSCLWFSNAERGLEQTLSGVKYYLFWNEGGGTLRVDNAPAAGEHNIWITDLNNHILEADGKSAMADRFYGVKYKNGTWELAATNDRTTANLHVLHSVNQRRAPSQPYMEVENLRVDTIIHVRGTNDEDKPAWFSMVDAGSAQLKAQVSGIIEKYHLPDHYHYSFNPGADAGGKQDFTFYPGPNGTTNLSYPLHTQLPVQGNPEIAHLGSDDARDWGVKIHFEWRRMDGTARHPVSAPNTRPGLSWAAATGLTIDTITGSTLERVNDNYENVTIGTIAKSDTLGGVNATASHTVTLNSAADSSGSCDTITVRVTVSVDNYDINNTRLTSTATAVSPELHVYYSHQVAAPTARNIDESAKPFQDDHLYLLANCGDRGRDYATRYFLTGHDGNPDAYLSNSADYDRIFRVERVGTSGNLHYRFYNPVLGKYLATVYNHDCFDRNRVAVQYKAWDPNNTTQFDFEIIPMAEHVPYTDSNNNTIYNTYNMIRPVGCGTGISLCPLSGATSIVNPGQTSDMEATLEGTTLRLGSGLNSVHPFSMDDGVSSHPTTFDDNYFYGNYWQLVVPTLLPPDISMNDTGLVTFIDNAGIRRGTRSEIKYQLSNPDGTWTTTYTYPATQPKLAEGQTIRYWKEGTSGTDATTGASYNYKYLNPSEPQLFTALRVSTPAQPEVDRNLITFDTTFTAGTKRLPWQEVTIIYTLDTNDHTSQDRDPLADSLVRHTYRFGEDNEVSYSSTITYRACAKNYLASEPFTYGHHATLTLQLTVVNVDATTREKTVTLAVVPNTIHSDNYRIYYATDGREPYYNHEDGVTGTSAIWYDDPDHPVGSITLEPNQFLRAKAYAVDDNYHDSPEVREYNGGQYMVFCHVVNPGASAAGHAAGDADFNMMHLNYRWGLNEMAWYESHGSEIPPYHFEAFNSHELDSSLIFRGSATAGTPMAVYSGVTGTYLDVKAVEGASFTVPVGTEGSGKQWIWGGEAAVSNGTPVAENDTNYTLHYREGGTKYYLVFDDSAGAVYPWKVVAASNPANLPDNLHAKVAFRASLENYQGGREFSAKGKNLYLLDTINQRPAWVSLDTLDNAWVSNPQGRSVTLRASHRGVDISYHKNIDINIYRTQYDDHNPNHYNADGTINLDQYVPWQQWHQFTKQRVNGVVKEYCHWYWDVPGYSCTWRNDYVDPAKIANPDYTPGGSEPDSLANASFVWTLNNHGYYYFVDSQGQRINDLTVYDTMVTLQRTASVGTDGEPDLSTLLTVRYIHRNSYANEGFEFDDTVKVRLFAEQAVQLTPATMQGMREARVAVISRAYAAPNYWSIFPGTEVTPQTLGSDYAKYYFMTGNPTMGVGQTFTQYSVWHLTNQQNQVRFHSLAYNDYAIYYRSDYKGGIYLVNTDKDRSLSFYHYIHGYHSPDGDTVISPHTLSNFRMDYDPYLNFWMTTFGTSSTQLPKYVCLMPKENQRVTLTSDNRWATLWYGAGNVDSLTTAADSLAAIETDFWKRRWTLEMSHITPPDVAMDPEGYVTLTHRLQTTPHLTDDERAIVNDHLEFYYKVVTIPVNTTDTAAYLATLDSTFWTPTAPDLYSPSAKPQLLKGETLITGTLLRDAGPSEDSEVREALNRTGYGNSVFRQSNTLNALTAVQTPVPGNVTVDGAPAVGGRKGDHIVMGVNHEASTLHWNSHGSSVLHYNDWYVKDSVVQAYIQYGNILLARAWRENELESDWTALALKQSLTLAVTGYDLRQGAGGNPDTVTVTGTLTSSTDFPPQLGHYRIYYNIGGSAIDTSLGNTPIYHSDETHPNGATVFGVCSVDQNVRTFTFTTTLPANATPLLNLRALPIGTTALYTKSNPVAQYLIPDNYTGTLTGSGTIDDPYQIGNAEDVLSVANLIKDGTPAAENKAAYATAWYKVTADIDMANIPFAGIGTSGHKFQGHWNGGYKVVSHLEKPLFHICNDAHVYNVVIDNSEIVGLENNPANLDGRCGGIASTAEGATRIYNSGVRATEKGSVTGTGVTGGIVGELLGTSRVINCYNFANVTSTGDYAAGVVGQQETASTATSHQGIVFNCLNYGKVHSNTQNVSPVLGGTVFTDCTGNDESVNCYNFFLFGSDYKEFYTTNNNNGSIAYNAALAAQERFLNRFEFIRLTMNSNREKCGWWVSGTYSEHTNVATINEVAYADTIGKWVLDKTIAPYPVVLPKYDAGGNAYQYASIINPDYNNDKDAWRDNAKDYEGKRLGKLIVHVLPGSIATNPVTNVTSLTRQIDGSGDTMMLSITDMDINYFDYNYGKVQLPYFQDYFGKNNNVYTVQSDNSSQDYIVTGWEIISVKKGSAAAITTAVFPSNCDLANRNDVQKDIYNSSASGNDLYKRRVFAQGGYYNVPEGVTEITIRAHWGKAVYLMDDSYEKTYNASNSSISNTTISSDLYGSPNTSIKINNQDVCTSCSTAISKCDFGSTVYDNAIVLVSNVFGANTNGPLTKQNGKNFTLMSIDKDNDHEPDYYFAYASIDRKDVGNIRFDFANVPGFGMVARINNSSMKFPMQGIDKPTGHFEITETALARYEQFEYGWATSNNPLIFNGGVIEQIVTKKGSYSGTKYIQMGGHVWFKMFSPGVHGDNNGYTKHCPVIVTGGEYESFYLSGMFRPGCSVASSIDNCSFFANGGKFGHYASGGQEPITGDVTVEVDHIIADEFYGGGINANNPIKGNITVTINNSLVGIYSGGPKYGDVADGKSVTTSASGTTFGTYYGAGIGGTSLNRHRTGQDEPDTYEGLWNQNNTASGGSSNNTYKAVNTVYSQGKNVSYCYNSEGKEATGNSCTGLKQYGGIIVDYDMEEMFYSGGSNNKHVVRFYQLEASLTKSNTNGVTSTLENCIINNDFYGGGHVGVVNGNAKSTLTSCTVYGNVYGGGNSGEVATFKAYKRPDISIKAQRTDYVPQVGVVIPEHERPASIVCRWEQAPDPDYSGPWISTSPDTDGVYSIYTTEDVNGFGQVKKTSLTIDGNTVVYGSVYGGGNEAATGDPSIENNSEAKKAHYTTVVVKDSAHVTGDVVGAGKKGHLTGSTSVTIGSATGDTAVALIPWVEGDIYGGAYSADVDGHSNVTIYDGILGPVYGGGYTGSVYKESNVTVLGGRIGYTKDTVEINNKKTVVAKPIKIPVGEPHTYFGVFGAGFGFGTTVGKNATVQVGSRTKQHTHIHINGSVFGGGEAGQVGTGFEILHGETVPARDSSWNKDKEAWDKWRNWYVNGDAGTFDSLIRDTANTPGSHSFYAQFYWPTFDTTRVSIQAPDTARNAPETHIAGAVFGGGRGYYIMEDEAHPGTYLSTQNNFKLAIAGAVYGSTEVTVGTEGQAASGIYIGSVSYYTHRDTAEKYDMIDFENMKSSATFWENPLYVYDVDNLKYVKLDPESSSTCRVKTRNNGSTEIALWHGRMYDDVVYYLYTGRASVVGGGEMGPVYGDSIITIGQNKHQIKSFNAEKQRFGTTEGGNTEVRIYSGTIGDTLNGEVNGCVYGGGLNADVDGTSRVTIDGTHAWVRGDVYAGGCMGSVYGYGRADDNEETTTTQQDLRRGWVRNAHGGSNLAAHGKGCNSRLVVGIANTERQTPMSDDSLLVSESVYGANGFSPSDGVSSVVVHHGKIGFVRAGIDINTTENNEDEGSDAIEGNGIVLNNQKNLSYEGNVYGGGFGPKARVKRTTVTVSGGVIRCGVFGGGELSAVYEAAEATDTSAQPYVHNVYGSNGVPVTDTTYYKATDIVYDTVYKTDDPAIVDTIIPREVPAEVVTSVTIHGGQMSMVCGGGRGYTNFLNTASVTPGAVMGNTKVTITDSAHVDTTTYDPDLGAGNVYGGGLEGLVKGNTAVVIAGGTVDGSAFAGGRGYNGKMLQVYASDKKREDIRDRSSRQAGWVIGNTSMTVTGGKVGLGVYGGGEGLKYTSSIGGHVLTDEVATVDGNTHVELKGGTVGGGHNMGPVAENGSYAGGRVASVLGYANILVSDSADVASVFGGNDISGKVYGTGRPTSGSDTVKTAYGNVLTSDSSSTYVRISGDRVRVGHVFGGGNGKYDYYTQPEFLYLKLERPVQPTTYVDIRTTGGEVQQAFGGGNKARVTERAQVHYTGTGLVDTLFAGGNSETIGNENGTGGRWTGTATVKVKAAGSPAKGNNINYIFGGNNQATMYILPELMLRKGKFGKVYGGGNAGAMQARETRKDVFGRDVTDISSYVLIDSDDDTITTALFGGCNNAVVGRTAFVDVRAGEINMVFGGNDVSEEVMETRVDILGGTIQKLFGGGNGYYAYTPNGPKYWNVFKHGHANEAQYRVLINSKGRPFVGTANVNIGGGMVNSSIYGGGYAGNCRNTHVIVNDTASYEVDGETKTLGNNGLDGGHAIIHGTIFGGGFGDQSLLGTGEAHVGNVDRKENEGAQTKTLALTELYHVHTLDDAKAYGGGFAGDVQNARIVVYPLWNKELAAIYGGCWGSDVLGETTVDLHCDSLAKDTYHIRELYGGNDFTGTVNRSQLNVYSGKYYKVYGGGNGLYDSVTLDGNKYKLNTDSTGAYTPGTSWGSRTLRVPNSKFPTVNIYGGEVESNVYGGGNLGTCIVDTTGQTSLEDYAFVQVNVHGGTFGNDIFAGAAGRSGMEPLIHGLKVLNMDGGTVRGSVYGGSESADDGYKNECLSRANSTQRPSSILNLVGGHVENNVYGGGYLGMVYGSAYVNVGKSAVDSSVAYNRRYAFPAAQGSQQLAGGPRNSGPATTYATYGNNDYGFKPNFDSVTADASTGTALGSDLIPGDLTLNASIYNGANWGNLNASDTFDYHFTTPGFYGGESRIRIDGNGYNTSSTDDPSQVAPYSMNIMSSLIGAGTSCEGGDVVRDIRILNYGEWNNCAPSRTLKSIQRADSVVFHNVGLALVGDQDAYSAYPSSKISITRCDTLLFVEKNVLQIANPAIKVKHLAFEDAHGQALVGGDTLYSMRQMVYRAGADCENVCAQVNAVDTGNYTTLLVNSGSYIDVFWSDDNNSVSYGDVQGYAYLRAEDNTQAIVTARFKTLDGEVEGVDGTNTGDGGFFSLCKEHNEARDAAEPTHHGIDGGRTHSGSTIYEFEYGNYGTSGDTYRAWKFGKGVRKRQVVLLAHTKPDMLDNNWTFTVDTNGSMSGGEVKLAVAEATLELPPTSEGSRYELVGGISVDEDNRAITLVDAAFIPDSGWWMLAETAEARPESSDTIKQAIKMITQNPSNTFGLAFSKGSHFGDDTTGLGSSVRSNPACQTAINGNAYFDGTNGYATTKVDSAGGTVNMIPTLKFYLTYDTNFVTTLMGDVVFTLTEKDSNNVIQGYVEVTISLSTILTEFKDQQYSLIAMKNDYDRHEYCHKLILPASMQRRSLYLRAVEWDTIKNGTDSIGTAKNFALTSVALATDAAHRAANLDTNTFALRMTATEDLSGSQSTTLGWNSREAAFANGFDVSSVSEAVYDCINTTVPRKVRTNGQVILNTPDTNGRMIGILDGRSSAAIDFTLFFDGDYTDARKPYRKGVRGKVKLHFRYYQRNVETSDDYNIGDPTEFTVTLFIKTRDKGDTIYIASGDSVCRDGIKLFPYGKAKSGSGYIYPNSSYSYVTGATSSGYVIEKNPNSPTFEKKGREPMAYVQSFSEALKFPVYEDGDVLCVIDTVYIANQTNFTMHGNNGNPIPIVRYTGSHYQFPGDTCAYRGPLVVLKQKGTLNLSDVIIDGGMVSSKRKLTSSEPSVEHYVKVLRGNDPYYAHDGSGWVDDTLCAVAPIFEIRDGGVLTLGNNTVIQNCWNADTVAMYAHGTATPSATYSVGDLTVKAPGSVAYLHTPETTYSLSDAALSATLTANPQLVVSNNVTLKNNLVGGLGTVNPDTLHTGAIHLEKGVVEIGPTANGKKITIVDNYALPHPDATAPANATWPGFVQADTSENVVSLSIKDDYLANLDKANVYLDYKALNNSPVLDAKSGYVSINSDPSAGTRIGISKEFPGIGVRDTMVVGRVTNGNNKYAAHAVEESIFVNDNRFASSQGAGFFHHTTISPSSVYFLRCATFQKQDGQDSLYYYVFDNAGHRDTLTDDIQQVVLKYTANPNSACPDETDSVAYSVHGGFYPYTYTWSMGTAADNLTKYLDTTTPYTNVEVNNGLLEDTANYAKATASNTNVSPLYGMTLANAAAFSGVDSIFHYSVTATDLAGCKLTKRYAVKMTFAPSVEAEDPMPAVASNKILGLGTGNYAWNDTVANHTATATRKYRGLHLIAEVAPNPEWGTVHATYETGGTVDLGANGTRLCPGDIVTLNAMGDGNHNFLQWDFDPYDIANTTIVMPNRKDDKSVMAYFGPSEYWKDKVTTQPSTCTLDYYGNVHVKDSAGLAWLISMCNGLNGEQIRSFFADTVFIHGENTGGKAVYDMSAYLWTPLGSSLQHPFSGVLTTPEVSPSNESKDGASTPQRDTVTIKGVIVNEPEMDYVGFFGHLDSAFIDGLNITYSVFRGQQYVGGIAAEAVNTSISNSSVTEKAGTNKVTLITGNYATGGIVGQSEGSTITSNKGGVKFMGEAIYNGGVAGYSENDSIANSEIAYNPHSSTLYNGGMVGYSKPASDSKSRGGSSIVNNYVRFDSEAPRLNRAGGLVGYATNTTLANNYVYGQKGSATLSGALGSMLGTGVHVENCFYEQGFDSKAFGYSGRLDTTAVTTFSGSGTEVILTDTLGSNVNLTRQLNKWVYAHGNGALRYWHSDTTGENHGYPVFGDPEYQPVAATREVTTCDSFVVDGTLATAGGTYYYHVVDSAEFTDSTITLLLTLNYSEFTELTDTVAPGEDYDGNGFHLDATEIDLMRQALQQEGTVTVVVNDTLQTLAGCDSVVTLYLTVSAIGIADVPVTIDLKVYPNPTTKYVTVEGTGLQEVEVYDAVSRRIGTLQTPQSLRDSSPNLGEQRVTLDLEGYPAGAYYLRIKTTQGVTIKKVIKR